MIQRRNVVVLLFLSWSHYSTSIDALIFSMSSSSSKQIFGIRNSGWTSSEWNWGYAQGTGHDCAKQCRQKYSTAEARKALVQSLVDASPCQLDFEEVKQVLALTWQRQRRYGDVMENMAQARRYEEGDELECSKFLVQDMIDRFESLRPSQDDADRMKTVTQELEANNVALARELCAGLVLNAMGFVEVGL